jgi:hypothetical protein
MDYDWLQTFEVLYGEHKKSGKKVRCRFKILRNKHKSDDNEADS